MKVWAGLLLAFLAGLATAALWSGGRGETAAGVRAESRSTAELLPPTGETARGATVREYASATPASGAPALLKPSPNGEGVASSGDAADNAIGIVVFGAVQTAEGGGPPASPRVDGQVRFDPRDSGPARAGRRVPCDGTYSVSGLTPGRWRVGVSIPGYQPMDEELVLSVDEPMVRRDFTLQPAVALLVAAHTPEGEPLPEALHDVVVNVHTLQVVAVRDGPAAPGPWLTTSDQRHAGIGSEQLRSTIHREGDLPAGFNTRLELNEPLPAWVCLVLGESVLSAQRVSAGTTEVRFVVPLDAVLARTGSVRLRVRSADTGLPLPGAAIHTGVESWTAGPDGVLLVE